MSITGKSGLIVELYENPLTEKKDDRIGRVVTNQSFDEDDIVAEIVARRTDLSPATIKLSLELANEVAIEKIANGASVSLGLGYFSLGVSGTFIGDNAKWDSSQHSLSVRITPKALLRETVKGCTVDVRGMAVSGSYINTLTDVTSGEVNSRLTPGGGVNMVGTKIKIDGENPTVGITLTEQTTEQIISIPRTSLLTNDPSKITFIVPASLPKGDYKLTLTTQFSTSANLLKEPRSCSLDYILNVL